MLSDIRDALRKGAPHPRSSVDIDAIVRGAGGVRARRRVVRAVLAVAVLAGLAVVSGVLLDRAARVPPPGPAQEGEGFSPTPKSNGRIAFVRNVNISPGEPALVLRSSLLVTDPDGGGITRLTDVTPYSVPAWSPDGDRIAFEKDGIWVLDPATGETEKLCDNPCADPAWSSDGEQLAFILDRDPDQLWVMRADGSGQRPLVQDLKTSRSPPAWSPDGELIALALALAGDNGDGSGDTIVLVDSASGAPVAEIIPEVPGFIGSLSWWPDATRLLFDWSPSSGQGGGIYVARRDGSEIALVSSCAAEGCSDRYPSVSPDGTQIAFTRARCDEPGGDCSFGDIMTMNIDGSGLRRVASGNDLDCCAAWQPVSGSTSAGDSP